MKRKAITTSRKRAEKMAAAIVRDQFRRVHYDGYREGHEAAREEFTARIRPTRERMQIGPSPERPFVQVWIAPPIDLLYPPSVDLLSMRAEVVTFEAIRMRWCHPSGQCVEWWTWKPQGSP